MKKRIVVEMEESLYNDLINEAKSKDNTITAQLKEVLRMHYYKDALSVDKIVRSIINSKYLKKSVKCSIEEVLSKPIKSVTSKPSKINKPKESVVKQVVSKTPNNVMDENSSDDVIFAWMGVTTEITKTDLLRNVNDFGVSLYDQALKVGHLGYPHT